MPQKPKPTRVDQYRKEVVQNEDHEFGNPSFERRDFALQFMLEDAQAGNSADGRYTRTLVAIMERFQCSRSEGVRAIRRGRVHMAKRFHKELPLQRAETCMQLQRIADKHEDSDPKAAVSALRTKAQIIGLFEPIKVEVEHGGHVDVGIQIDAALEVLDERGRAALDLVMAQLAAAESAGKLALPAGEDEHEPEDSIMDAEIIEPGSN